MSRLIYAHVSLSPSFALFWWMKTLIDFDVFRGLILRFPPFTVADACRSARGDRKQNKNSLPRRRPKATHGNVQRRRLQSDDLSSRADEEPLVGHAKRQFVDRAWSIALKSRFHLATPRTNPEASVCRGSNKINPSSSNGSRSKLLLSQGLMNSQTHQWGALSSDAEQRFLFWYHPS